MLDNRELGNKNWDGKGDLSDISMELLLLVARALPGSCRFLVGDRYVRFRIKRKVYSVDLSLRVHRCQGNVLEHTRMCVIAEDLIAKAFKSSKAENRNPGFPGMQ